MKRLEFGRSGVWSRVILVAGLLAGAVLPSSTGFAQGAGDGSLRSCRSDLRTHCAAVAPGAGGRVKCLLDRQDKLTRECQAVLKEHPAAKRAQAKGGSPSTTVSPLPGPASGPNTGPTAGPVTGAAAGADQAGANPLPGPKEPPTRKAVRTAAGTAAPGGKAARVAGPMAACNADLATLCKDDPARLRCLNANRAKLSSECAKAVLAQKEARGSRTAACAADVTAFCSGDAGGKVNQCLRTNRQKLSPACAESIAAGSKAVASDGESPGRNTWRAGKIPRDSGLAAPPPSRTESTTGSMQSAPKPAQAPIVPPTDTAPKQ